MVTLLPRVFPSCSHCDTWIFSAHSHLEGTDNISSKVRKRTSSEAFHGYKSMSAFFGAAAECKLFLHTVPRCKCHCIFAGRDSTTCSPVEVARSHPVAPQLATYALRRQAFGRFFSAQGDLNFQLHHLLERTAGATTTAASTNVYVVDAVESAILHLSLISFTCLSLSEWNAIRGIRSSDTCSVQSRSPWLLRTAINERSLELEALFRGTGALCPAHKKLMSARQLRWR